MAVPVALLMIAGEFDLSAGVMVGSSGLLLGLLVTNGGLPIWPAIAIVLLFGLAIGFVNGMLVVTTKLPSFIVTLATFFILRGLNLGGTLRITGKVYIENIDEASGYAWARKLFGATVWSPYDFQVRVVWWIAITVIATWVLSRMRVGNSIFAVGGD